MDPGQSTQVLTVNYFYNLYDTLTRWDTALRHPFEPHRHPLDQRG